MNVETVPIDSIHVDPANVRVHPERNLASIKASLARFGQQKPIVIDEGGIVRAGNGTLEAARALGWETVNVVRTPLKGSEATAYAIADNRTAELAEWDDTALAATLRALQSEDFDLAAVGYSGDELQGLIDGLAVEALANGTPAEDPGPQIDRADELQRKWGVKPGDLFVIPSKTMPGGEHRLLCGDSTKAEDVARVMGGEKADLCFTSPPYSDQRDYDGDDLTLSHLSSIFSVWRNAVCYWVVNLGLQYREYEIVSYWDDWIASARASGLKLLSWNVWDKVNASSVRAQTTMFARTHEWLFVFGEGPMDLNRTWEKSESSAKREASYRISEKGQKVTTRRMTDGTVRETPIGEVFDQKNLGTVLTINAEMSRVITSHPAMFPVALPAIHLEAMTNPGSLCCDPFCGSGTTIVAAEQTGRLARGIEIAPRYVAVALERLEGLGLKPHLTPGVEQVS